MTDLILYGVLGFLFRKPIATVAEVTDAVLIAGGDWTTSQLSAEPAKFDSQTGKPIP